MKVRFAPSPTGLLHVGNARVALANWLFARRRGAKFVLRLDDTDMGRSTPEFAKAIEEDLHWLGLDWDETFTQSSRLERYAAAMQRLITAKRLYPCFESEEELIAKRERRKREGRAPVYDREALRMTAAQIEKARENGKQPYWRFQLSPRSITWHDAVLGAKHVKLQAISDPVLVRADGTFLYTFASVVDDLETAVTHIIRGEDHVTNTGVQLDIWEALGGDARKLSFAHLPLLTDSDGGPLSKRLGSLSLRQMRRDGIEPAALAGMLATLGSSADPVAAMPADLVETFDISRFGTSAARFDVSRLLVLNRRMLHALPFEAVRTRLPEGATEAFWLAVRGNLDLPAEARDWWEVVTGTIESPDLPQPDRDLLATALAILPEGEPGPDTWFTWTGALAEQTGAKGRKLFMPLRLALTGADKGPDLKTFLPLLPRATIAQRLAAAIGTPA
ncbi:glutamate--tRNA ligase [Humitalea sp. 24SJ18S-53]|uniref:glutamate--tRNA ligase n=1 Tax=Humitalea sp. 24SJ18S-53 TaxID=3422307 RepID=UPI003D66E6B5